MQYRNIRPRAGRGRTNRHQNSSPAGGEPSETAARLTEMAPGRHNSVRQRKRGQPRAAVCSSPAASKSGAGRVTSSGSGNGPLPERPTPTTKVPRQLRAGAPKQRHNSIRVGDQPPHEDYLRAIDLLEAPPSNHNQAQTRRAHVTARRPDRRHHNAPSPGAHRARERPRSDECAGAR